MAETIFFLIGRILAFSWWLILYIILKPIATSFWLFWRRERFAFNTPYVIFELNIPREINKSPKAMEQIFTTIHTLRNAPQNFKTKYLDGEITRSFGLEIVSFGGQVHFYMRVPQVSKSVVESAIFSYYPDIEVQEVPDYVDRLPVDLTDATDKSLTVWGNEYMLAREAAYPIKTYPEFESPEEENQYDPISSLLEVMGKIRPGEIGCMQYVIIPRDAKWRDEWAELVGKLKEKKSSAVAQTGLRVEFPGGGPLPVFVSKSETAKDQPAPLPAIRSPGETKVLEAIENNLSKPAFDVALRVLYCGPTGNSNEGAFGSGISGALNQYQSLSLNSFRPNPKMMTRTAAWISPYIFPLTRLKYRRERIIFNYRRREIPQDTGAGKFITSYLFNWNIHSRMMTLNTESLATLFHPPTHLVLTAPHIQRVESRKSGPPAGLAVFGEDSAIEKFQ